MAAIIGLRGMQRGDNFELATNVTNAGNFDDLVYTAGGRRYYLQLKHTDNPDTTKLVPSFLEPLLHKCFESYYKIEDKNNSKFIIYTDKQLGPKLSPHKRKRIADNLVQSFFQTSTGGEIFNFTRHDDDKIDVYLGVEKRVRGSKEFDELSVPEQNNKISMISDFLRKLIMVIGQKGQSELDDVIKEEMRKKNSETFATEVNETELLHFKKEIENWWRNKNKKSMTPETLRNWLQEATTKAWAPVVRSIFKSCPKTLVGTEMKFSESEISLLRAELSNNRAVHLRSDALTLCSILLLDCLDTSKFIFVTFESLQSNKNMLLHAWLGGHWEWLTVFCDSTVRQSDISDTCLEISEIIKSNHSNKRVIILTSNSVQQITDFFVTIEQEFNFDQLSDVSKKIVLDKKIGFQGCELRLRSVLLRHGNVQNVLGPELVIDLITEETVVNIGGSLQVSEGYYAPRELERYIWLHSDVLQNSNDVFAVSGTTREDLLKIVPSDKTVECVRAERIDLIDLTEDMSSRIFLLLDEDAKNSFLAIGEKLQGKTLHWVECKNGEIMWKISQGVTDSLLGYIDADKTGAEKRILAEFMKRGNCEVNENSIWELGERIVLVVDEPGMGKSSTTTQVAWNRKERDPTSWVVRINWNDHTRELQDIDAATFNLDSLVEFLCSTAFTESKYTDFEKILLTHALQDSGNVTVLMDGFDEISPTHADKAAAILSELKKTKVRRVWITSRPVQKEKLERKLSVFSFGMKRLPQGSQIEMLRKLWKYKEGEKEEELNDFLQIVNKSVQAENFTGCPLYVTMIATVYDRDIITYLNADDWLWPEIDGVHLYEVFVEKKLHIYLTEKQKANITIPSVLDEHEYSTQKYLEDFEKCALVGILSPCMLESLHIKKIEEQIQPFAGWKAQNRYSNERGGR